MRKIFLFVAILFASTFAWGASETITWDGKSLNGSGGTYVSAGTATAVNGDTYHAGTLSISSNTIATEKKKHTNDSYWEDFSGTQTSTSTNATTTARVEFPITVEDGYSLNISSIKYTYASDGGGGPAVHAFVVQGTTSTWLGYASSASTITYNGLNIDLVAGGAKLVLVLGVASNLNNGRGFKFSNISIEGTSALGKNTVYLDPNISDWKQGNERYAVYYFESANPTNEGWVDMTATGSGDCSGVYKADISLAYDKCVICRMNGSTTENKWSNKWDQTDDLTVADGMYCTITASSGGSATCTFNNTPFQVCVTGTWLAFSGETITLNATCPGASHFQWYKGGTEESNKIEGATNSTYTEAVCTIEDGGNYYCKAWAVAGSEVTSEPWGVKVPHLNIKTGRYGSDDDINRIALIRANEEAAIASGSLHLGVGWDYGFFISDGLENHGQNNGDYNLDDKLNSKNCTDWDRWIMNTLDIRCVMRTTKEGTYTFAIKFNKENWTDIKVNVTYPPMVQTPGRPIYMEKTAAMADDQWNRIFYRIGKGNQSDGDSENWATAYEMTLVPGTARYYQSVTPDWGDDFWAWHIGNNVGDAGSQCSIYKTNSGDASKEITRSINFSGDEIPEPGWTIYLTGEGKYGTDGKNNHCKFYTYTHSDGMVTHKVSVKKTTHGTIRVEWIDVNGDPQTDEGYSERDINNLAHTCILTITGVPESCRYKLEKLKVNGSTFTSGNTFILTADAEIEATFKEQNFSVNLHTNGGTINSGNVTKYTHEKGAILPTDVTKGTESFGGWYDNSSLTGMPITEISPDECGNKEYWAKWGSPCEFQPIITKVSPTFTIWDGKLVDAAIANLSCNFDTTGIKYSLKSATPAINGCTFIYSNNQIHLVGTPTVGNATVQTVNVTITITNDCAPSTEVSINQEIQIYPATQKAKVAFIITGKEGGGFDEYTNDDKTACDDLLTYLAGHYDVTCVNGYATKSPAAIADYYQDYDLLVVTDFLETGKGYTNAIGTLIDKKPILSFEAYVANLSNWHIQSNPTDPSPKVKRMYVLCNGHAIFKDEGGVDIVDDKDSVTVLSALSSAGSAKGLQGFVINEAPDFLFIATVKDAANKRDLVVCCERQKVFPARLMLFGVNFYEMANLSDAGKIIIRQMMDYLLLTDEKEVSDCSLVFDNGNDGAISGGGNGKWNNPQNWWPTYSRVPSPFQPTRIIRPCTVDNAEAHAGSVKINVGEDHSHNQYTGKITIAPTGGLTVAGAINKVKDTRWATLLETDEEDIEIQSNENHNGALVFGNKETNVRATVQYYSRAFGAPTTPTWQYIGIPTQAGQTAIEMYHAAWMCRWESSGTLGGLWQWVANEDVLQPFEGYCITQAAAKTYTLAGNLNEPKERTLALDIRDADGYAFAANSWTAPIKISQLQDDDFTNAEKTIYIYHTGTYADWTAHGTPVDAHSGTAATFPGQYAVVPIHSSPYLADADSVIPAMQGFFVKTDPGKEASLKLVYNRVVYDSKYFKTSTQPMRAPSRTMELSDAPEVMVLTVVGDSLGADRVHILARDGFSENFEDGWDGRKIEGDENAPMLAVVKDAGDMAVAAIETAEERELSFRAGSETEYTFCFQYEGETIYLYDRLADQAVEIKTGNTYSFTAENKTAAKRFIITKNPPRIPTGIENTSDASYSDAEKCIIDGQLYIIKDNRFYDARGVRVHSFNRKEVTP